MNRQPRVLHVATADMSLSLLLGPQLRAFALAGYEVLTASAPGPHVADLRASGIQHHALHHATRSFAPGQDLRALRELHALFRALRPDVVHTHNPKPGVYGRLAAKKARVPVIVNTVHGLYATPEDRLAKRAIVYGLERVAAWCSDAELIQNSEDLETLRRIGVPDHKLHLLGNGIDLTRFDPTRVDAGERSALRAQLEASDEEVLCGVVGRLVREKGMAEVVVAAEALARREAPVRFVVVGPHEPEKADGISEDDIERAKAHGVRFLGFRDDMVALYGAMDVFALPSHREGFPRAAMEASAMGLPVIATAIRGCRQVVDDGRTGLLIPPRDADALAAAVGALASDPGRREEMGRAARVKASQEFDQQRVIDITLETYDRLLRRSRGRAEHVTR